MKKIFSIVSIKEFISICLIKAFVLLLRKLKYYDHYESLLKLIRLYTEKGYQLKHRHKLLEVSGVPGFPELRFLLRPNSSDSYVFEQVIEHLEYLPLYNHIEALNLNNKINTIIDAGANVGLTTLFFSHYFPTANIISVEADYFNCIELERNIVANGLKEKVIGLHKALWNKNNVTLKITSDFRDHESWSRRVQDTKLEKESDEFNCVSSITIKKIIEEYHLKTIDILKIDIEGAEKELFSDPCFIQTIARTTRFIALEIHDEFGVRTQINKVLMDVHFILFAEGETSFYFNSSLV